MNDFAKGQPLIDCTLKVYVMEDRSPTLDIICKRCRSVYYNFIGRRVCDLIVIKLNRLQYEERNFQWQSAERDWFSSFWSGQLLFERMHDLAGPIDRPDGGDFVRGGGWPGGSIMCLRLSSSLNVVLRIKKWVAIWSQVDSVLYLGRIGKEKFCTHISCISMAASWILRNFS